MYRANYHARNSFQFFTREPYQIDTRSAGLI